MCCWMDREKYVPHNFIMVTHLNVIRYILAIFLLRHTSLFGSRGKQIVQTEGKVRSYAYVTQNLKNFMGIAIKLFNSIH